MYISKIILEEATCIFEVFTFKFSWVLNFEVQSSYMFLDAGIQLLEVLLKFEFSEFCLLSFSEFCLLSNANTLLIFFTTCIIEMSVEINVVFWKIELGINKFLSYRNIWEIIIFTGWIHILDLLLDELNKRKIIPFSSSLIFLIFSRFGPSVLETRVLLESKWKLLSKVKRELRY